MNVLGEDLLDEFGTKHASARPAIRRWLRIVKTVEWKNLIEVKSTFPSADYVKGYIVFDLGGNNFRAVTVAQFASGNLIIQMVMTHAEYDKWKA